MARRLKTVVGARSLREVARRTGANSETLRRYMRDGNPCARFLARFCREFGVSADWILGVRPRSARATPRLPPDVTKVRLTLALSKNRVRIIGGKPAATGRGPAKGRANAARMARAPVPPPPQDAPPTNPIPDDASDADAPIAM